jgi:hypothetical protein
MSAAEERTETEEVVREVLASHPHLFLATSVHDMPWVSGVYFAETATFELVSVLETHGRTLTAIRTNPNVAVVVTSGLPYEPFLQGSATVDIIGSDDADQVRSALVAKVPQVEAFFQYPHDAVRLRVSSWRVTDVTRGWIPGRTVTG